MMKKIRFLLLIMMFLPLLNSCRSGGKENDNAEDLMSIRTLGLAYLEEFKLEEAEKEFLKFIDLAPKEKLGYANLGLTYLRMGKYDEAEKQLQKAIKIDSLDADIRLILSTVYKMNDQPERAVAELKKALSFAPDHAKTLYEISEIYSAAPDSVSISYRRQYLDRLIAVSPENLVPRLNLTDILIRTGVLDQAMDQMEIIRKQFPEFPKEASDYYAKTVDLLRKNDKEKAIVQFTIFHNYLKVTAPYQAGIMELKGPGGSLIGFPVITFDRQATFGSSENKSILDVMKFNEISASAGLDVSASSSEIITFCISADYDGDDDIDIYAASYDPTTSKSKHFLYNNDSGRFTELSKKAGIDHSGKDISAVFADYDNDGFQDLYIVREEGDILYRNDGKGTFDDVTSKARLTGIKGGKKALFFDADHDGDLDLFEARNGMNFLFRNNSDGTFTEQAEKMGLSGGNMVSTDAAFGDFDEDGDIDLFVTNENGSNSLYSNQRQGIYRDVTYESGLASEGGSGAVAVSDYNNDGFPDIFILSVNGEEHSLFRNMGNGKFEKENDFSQKLKNLRLKPESDALFLDFDNDGFSDLLIAGEEGQGNGLHLLHNDGKGSFSDSSDLIPSENRSGHQVTVFDYNDDGDMDIAVAQTDKIALLRNDGGNNNHYVKIKLVGLRAGSAKNNHFGIGAKLEIRAGDLYQSMVVTNPNVLFGIGGKSTADVIRITWTNGVPQNIFFPAADQALIEAQTLKGSCPFLYTWDGNQYSFVKDIMWRSGLGMPLGIMGGTTAYAFPDASDDYLKIPGEMLKAKDGKFSMQVTSELWETIYLDKLKLVTVDHPDSTDVFVEEQFTPPPFPGMKIFTVTKKIFPVSASDSKGNDLLSFLKDKDDSYVSDFISDKYQGVTEMKEIILDPGKKVNDRNFFLFMNGWIFPTDASINVALSQSETLKVIPPEIQVMNRYGHWETVVNGIGFPMGKNKTVIVDLSGKFLSHDHKVKIRTNMEIYWDQIFFAENVSASPVITTDLLPEQADFHYRGFSATFRKGGRYGPHWFDYSDVSTEPKWRDLTGNYTRYGDVMELLQESDNKYIISNAGDEVTVSFNANKLPILPKGWKRDFLINSVGWVKDGDINTAFGNTVLPLPFHGMKSYPPSPEDKYPDDPDLARYNKEYNTRNVNFNGYLNALKK
jgi:hypothetical protein